MRNRIREAARGVGIAKKMGWHTFRHTCATLLRASGADIKVAQELLRHASCRVALDTHTQAITEHKGPHKTESLAWYAVLVQRVSVELTDIQRQQ